MTLQSLINLCRLRRRRQDEISEELQTHLDLAIRDRIERGDSPEEARSAASKEFGNVGLVHEATRSVWTWTALEQLFQDLHSGVRIVWKSPALTATAVILIALVIGGNTTIYCVLHALLAKPAPGVHADHLVSVGYSSQFSEQPSPYSTYLAFSAKTETLGSLFAFGSERLTVGLKDGSYAAFGSYATPNYFESLGVTGLQGHGLRDSADTAQESALPVVISHRFWQERFQGSDDAIGSPLLINGYSSRVVGIAPPLFEGATLGLPEDLWFPIIPYFRAIAAQGELGALRTKSVAIFGKLNPGISIEQAQTELQGIFGGVQAADPSIDRKLTIKLTPYTATIFGMADTGNQTIAILSVVTAITLLIVCANVSNLLLGRALVRRRETALRQALGASRGRVLRMLLAEGLSISMLAWLACCVVAFWTSKAIPLFLPFDQPNINGMRFNHGNMDFTPDWTVLGYAMILALIGAVSFTVIPAWQTLRRDVLPDLRAGEQGIARGRSRIATTLVVTQFALTAVLLTSVGLAYRASSSLDAANPGFDKTNLLLMTINPTLNIKGRISQLGVVETALQRFRQVPGVISASYVRMPPPRPARLEMVSTGRTDEQPTQAMVNYVGSEYLKTLGLAPIAGRDFVTADRSTSHRSAVISQGLADLLWPGQSATGQMLQLARSRELVEVIGVSPNIVDPVAAAQNHLMRYSLLFAESEDPAPATAQRSLTGSGEITFLLRYTGGLDSVASLAAATLRQVDSRVPIIYARTMERQMAAGTIGYRVSLDLLSMFAGIAIVIASIGQYAVVAFMMRRRTAEFGVRMALGASSQQLFMSILKEGLLLTGAGIALGFIFSIAGATLMKSVLYGTSPTDARTYTAVFALLSLASLLACCIPAWRAANMDPLRALRYD